MFGGSEECRLKSQGVTEDVYIHKKRKNFLLFVFFLVKRDGSQYHLHLWRRIGKTERVMNLAVALFMPTP